jgi:hypothetical protein
VFLGFEDETGIVNVIINPDLFERQKTACVAARYVQVKGTVHPENAISQRNQSVNVRGK